MIYLREIFTSNFFLYANIALLVLIALGLQMTYYRPNLREEWVPYFIRLGKFTIFYTLWHSDLDRRLVAVFLLQYWFMEFLFKLTKGVADKKQAELDARTMAG